MARNALPDDPATLSPPLRTVPLDAWHRQLGARMTAFAGYAMPLQYDFPAEHAHGDLASRCRGGVMAEHLHTRSAAGLFDVSHMGQAMVTGTDAATALERLMPGDIAGLRPGRQRYTLLTNEAGGIVDDLMVARTRRRAAVPGRQRQPQGRRFYPYRSQPSGWGDASGLRRPRASRAAGPRGVRCAGTPVATRRRPPIHGRCNPVAGRHRMPGFAVRLHRRGRLRDLAACQPGGSAG